MLEELSITLGVTLLAFGAAVGVQALWDRRRSGRRASRLDALVELPPGSVPPEFPFLASLPPGRTRHGLAAESAADHCLVHLPADDPSLGYTLLARRVGIWSARALVLPPIGGGVAPPRPQLVGEDQDPRRAKALAVPALREALAADEVWLLVEGPWRVLGWQGPAGEIPGRLERVIAAGPRVLPAIPEPDEFSGGLEWNV